MLELVNDSFSLNNTLYSNGIKNILDVAKMPRAKWVDDGQGIFGSDYEAVKYYEVASSLARTSVNEINPLKDGLNPPSTDEDLETYDNCGCGDCESAVGPMAYLSDLLAFSTERLTDNGIAVDTSWITTNLYRDFGAIPIDCDELENNTCQARIATDTLDKNYANLQSVPSSIADTLASRRFEYYIEAYKSVLINLGTNYEELQSFQTVVDTEERKRYANRLGIVLDTEGSTEETIEKMYVDILADAPVTLTPVFLDDIFGIKQIDGTQSTGKPDFEVWQEERIREIWGERDHVNTVYSRGEKVFIDPDFLTVDDFRLPDVEDSVAFKIWKLRMDFLMDECYNEFRAETTVSEMIAKLGGTFTYTNAANNTVNKSNIWQGNTLVDLTAVVSEAESGNEASLDTLWDTYRLRLKEGQKIIELDSKETVASDEVTDQDKIDATNLFTLIVKRAYTTNWISEEQTAVDASQLELSSLDFWISEKEPTAGNWPLELESNIPLVDPELITLAGLPERTFQVLNKVVQVGNPLESVTATELYNLRLDSLSTIRTNLESGTTLPDLIDYAFQGTSPQYQYDSGPKTFVDLNDDYNNPATRDQAIEDIQNELKLEVEDFTFIMGLASKYGTTDVNYELSEKERLFSILVTSRKVFSLYNGWISKESTAKFWELRKAQLPAWRTSVQERNEWTAAFKEHNKAPIIDGDLIGPAYMRNPVEGDRAFTLWLQRYNQMNNSTGWFETIASHEPFETTKNLANFDELVEFFVMNSSGVTLEEVILRKESGEDISSTLRQLNLSSTDFSLLRDLRNGLDEGIALNTSQLDGLFYTIAKTQKTRWYYTYRKEEKEDNVTKSPDYFVSRDTDYYTYPPTVPYQLNSYLVSEQELNSWRSIVSSRLDEFGLIHTENKANLLEVDDDTMPFLRDALVEAIYNSENFATAKLLHVSLDEKARKLGDQLLIDLQDNCCTKTNRVAQAIETMQQLIWKSHTEDILSDYPDIVLNVDSFDTVWQWMGSYANWRASMFVYLYPENILLPSLKKESTAGFRTILENTQNNRNFNPYQACEVSNDFRQYIKDVSSLRLKCSAQTSVVTRKEDECAGLNQTIENLTFVFATAENSGKSYYMTIKSTEESNTQKTSWQTIPNIPEDAILKGADAYRSSSRGINYVYLFFTLNSLDGLQEFYCIRFDANSNVWESEFDTYKVDIGELYQTTDNWYELADEVPEDFELLSVEVCQNTFYWMPPHLSISMRIDISSFATFSRSIDYDGVKLRSEELWNMWIRFQFPDITGIGFAMSQSPVKKVVFKYTLVASTKPYYYGNEYYFIDQYNNVYKNDIGSNGETKWEIVSTYIVDDGAFAGEFTQKDIFTLNQKEAVFRLGFEDQDGSSQVENNTWQVARGFDPDNNVFQPFFLNQEFDYSIANRGLSSESLLRPLIYQQKNPQSQIFFTSIAYSENPNDSEDWTFIFGETSIPLNPIFSATPAFNPDLDRSELDLLKTKSEENLTANTILENPRLRLYSEEAYYYAPMEIALKLSDNGYYAEALKWFRMVYDYFAKEDERKIYYGLKQEEDFANLQDRVAEWYEDPLNPHAIAATRANSFTRFTMMSIANTLLAFANAEFTIDNSETVPRAREMYEDIIDLLGILDHTDPCARDESIRSLDSYIDNDLIWKYKWQETFQSLENLAVSEERFTSLIDDIETELNDSGSQQEKYAAVEALINTAKGEISTETLTDRLSNYTSEVNKRIGASMEGGKLENILTTGNRQASKNLDANLSTVTGYTNAQLETSADLKWLYDGSEAGQADNYKTNPVAKTQSREIREFSRTNPIEGYNNANPFPEIRLSGMTYLFCVNPNPMVTASLMMAHANLYKIHNCMNIAGMVRELGPFAAPTDATSGMPSIGVGGTLQIPGQASLAPTNYRYAYLVERAKQLVSFAQQMEGTLLQSLEKFDAESYSQLKAEQDLDLAKANIKLQDLKVKEAESGKVLAELQKDRAQLQVDGLTEMIDDGLLSYEEDLIKNFELQAKLEIGLAYASFHTKIANAGIMVAGAGGGSTSALSVLAASIAASVLSTTALVQAGLEVASTLNRSNIAQNQIWASFQRREQEWNYQKTIANQDVKIGSQQIKIADDRIRVVSQEREIADLQQEQAQATLDFLKTKFTNAELYEWMSGILEDVYSFFLQEATAMSKLAEQQLAFERQINLPSLIKSDYWNINANTGFSLTGGDSPDRKGLTGSARLLRDLSELEIYAQDTNQRKLQITKVISLNEHDPVEMENFRSTGVLSFATTHRDFDWDHPGQYLRTIRRVSVTVIALTPPTEGIKATLINNGISSVITSTNNLFQTKVIARTPERIVLSSPYNEYGVFQLDTNDTMYRPFEGSGVETLWELRMEKASNPFDYRSIADVLLTIEYDALHSEQYNQITRAQLNQEDRTGSLVFSLRNDLPDQWYELMNSDGSGLSSSFEVRNADLAPNVLSNQLTKVKVYASFDKEKMTADEMSDTDSITGSFIVSKGQEITNDQDVGAQVPINQLLLNSLYDFQGFPGIEEEIQGEWYMRFTETTKVLEMIEKGHLRDLILIIEYSADRVPFIINGNA